MRRPVCAEQRTLNAGTYMGERRYILGCLPEIGGGQENAVMIVSCRWGYRRRIIDLVGRKYSSWQGMTPCRVPAGDTGDGSPCTMAGSTWMLRYAAASTVPGDQTVTRRWSGVAQRWRQSGCVSKNARPDDKEQLGPRHRTIRGGC